MIIDAKFVVMRKQLDKAKKKLIKGMREQIDTRKKAIHLRFCAHNLIYF